MSDDIRERLNNHSARLKQLELDHVRSTEQRKSVIQMIENLANTVDTRLASIDKHIENSRNNSVWAFRIIAAAAVTGVITYIFKGGMYVP